MRARHPLTREVGGRKPHAWRGIASVALALLAVGTWAHPAGAQAYPAGQQQPPTVSGQTFFPNSGPSSRASGATADATVLGVSFERGGGSGTLAFSGFTLLLLLAVAMAALMIGVLLARASRRRAPTTVV